MMPETNPTPLRIDWPHIFEQLRAQIVMIAMFVLFVGTAVAGRTDQLPALLQPYRTWFEALGWLAGLYTAYQLRAITARPPTQNRRALDRLPRAR